VCLKDGKSVEVQADDVDLDVVGENGSSTFFWNFQTGDDDDNITVAAIPFNNVNHIVSRPG
jgi:hypothetical protein